jgi:alpha-tubulin suppressor-like RCC1 family protein
LPAAFRIKMTMPAVDMNKMARRGNPKRRAAARGWLTALFVFASLLALQEPAPAATTLGVSNLAVGYDQTCAVRVDQTASCWGRNNHGQLGDGTNDDRFVPTAVFGGITWATIDGGDQASCGVAVNGLGFCWGRNHVGQLGDGSTSNAASPTAVTGPPTWLSISVGGNFSCGVATTRDAYCWGLGTNGQLGNSGTSSSSIPVLVSGGHQWATVQAADNSGTHACGVTVGGAAYCWGLNGNGQLGKNDLTPSSAPVLVDGGYTWASISASGTSTCGVTTTDVGYCWGGNYIGQVGDSTTSDRLIPTLVSGGYTWKSIDAGGGATCGIRTNAAAYCWGANGLGALGTGNNSNSSIPVAVVGGYRFLSVDVGGGGACGRTEASVVYCWGWNAYGQLGDSTLTNRNAPVGVLNITNLEAGTQITVTVNPFFNFVVTGYNSGTCNGATITSTSSTGTAMPLRPTTGANAIAGQTLTISSNAGGGYTIFARSTGALSDGNGNTIPDWTGTNGVPVAFPAAGNAHFGYTTDHALSGSAARFQTDKWAGFSGANAEVSHSATVVSSDETHLCVQAGISGATAAGVYTTTLIYTAVPTF